jgi:hypothetical protein
MKYTYNDIAKKYGIKKTILYKRVFNLGIKGSRIGRDGIAYFNQNEVYKILDHKPINYKIHSRKIQIIELYQSGIIGRNIAEILRISTKLTYDCIREYNETNCIIVESKINYL